MTNYSIDDIAELIGDDRLPTGAVPAAWWLTVDPGQIASYDRWSTEYNAAREQVAALAESIGVDVKDARLWSAWGTEPETLSGFAKPRYMDHWNRDHPEYRPIPPGWRVDKKKNLLVPSRKTKADRESQANKDFAAVKGIPNVRAYMSGLPHSVHLEDRSDFGGTIYPVQYRRGARCVWAYCGGDPDRQPEYRLNDQVDTAIWHRQPLSMLVALMERAQAAKAAATAGAAE